MDFHKSCVVLVLQFCGSPEKLSRSQNNNKSVTAQCASAAPKNRRRPSLLFSPKKTLQEVAAARAGARCCCWCLCFVFGWIFRILPASLLLLKFPSSSFSSNIRLRVSSSSCSLLKSSPFPPAHHPRHHSILSPVSISFPSSSSHLTTIRLYPRSPEARCEWRRE